MTHVKKPKMVRRTLEEAEAYIERLAKIIEAQNKLNRRITHEQQ